MLVVWLRFHLCEHIYILVYNQIQFYFLVVFFFHLIAYSLWLYHFHVLYTHEQLMLINQTSVHRHTSGLLRNMWFGLTTEMKSLFHVMLTFPSLNEISPDQKTNKHISPPVSLQIMPVTYELNFLTKHIFIGGSPFLSWWKVSQVLKSD